MVKIKKTGANQYKVDPRQSLFLTYYLDPKSKTFSNGLQSALKAGYEEEYAKTITAQMPDWLSESISEMSMVHKAERNLDKIMDLEVEQTITNKDGVTLKAIDPSLVGQVAKVSMFVAERLNKKKYSAKTEIDLNNPDGNLKTIIINKYGSNDKSTAKTDGSVGSV